MKNISILGSTGSIGRQTLDIIRRNKDVNIVALACCSNIKLFEEQVKEFKPKYVCIFEKEASEKFKSKFSFLECKVLTGMSGLIEISTLDEIDLVLTALSGMIGIVPTVKAIEAKKDIALANKETLCCAGHIIMPLAKNMNVNILPVDSEHSAIFQCLQGNKDNKISRILLTASGGPFRGFTKEMLKNVTLADALKHPNWSMGKKITIDSSTMVNKGLELIEAYHLFGIDAKNIEIVVQPSSIIHSMIEYEDGAVMAQMGSPDMRLPIQYSIYYPERRYLNTERLDFSKLNRLEFNKPDEKVFEALSLARLAITTGDSLPTVFNAANEYAVKLFLKEEIKYLDIIEMIKYAMNEHKIIKNPSIEQILDIEKKVYQVLEGFKRCNI